MDNTGPVSIGSYLQAHLGHDAIAILQQALLVAMAIGIVAWLDRQRRRRRPQTRRIEGAPVFVDRLKGWPLVLQQADGQYVIRAPHWPPGQGPQDSDKLRFGMALVLVIVSAALWTGSMAAGILMTLGGTWVIWKWPATQARSADIVVNRDHVLWISPAGEPCEVDTKELQMSVRCPHRLAQMTAWTQDQQAQRNMAAYQATQQAFSMLAKQPPPPVPGRFGGVGIIQSMMPAPMRAPPTYQVASELLVHSGLDASRWEAVAEIGNDEHGQRANELRSAILHAAMESLKVQADLDGQKRQAAAAEKPAFKTFR